MRSAKMCCFVLALFCAVAAAQQSAPCPKPQADCTVKKEHREPKVVLATAKTIFIESQTEFMKAPNLEKALQDNPDFGTLGLVITTNRNTADLVVKVQRSPFTTSFPYEVSNPASDEVVASGKVNSIGGTAYGKIGRELLRKIKQSREQPNPAAAQAKP